MGSQQHSDELVQSFVSFLNAQEFEAKRFEEVPVELRGPLHNICPTGSRGKFCRVQTIPGWRHLRKTYRDITQRLFMS